MEQGCIIQGKDDKSTGVKAREQEKAAGATRGGLSPANTHPVPSAELCSLAAMGSGLLAPAAPAPEAGREQPACPGERNSLR